jgi:MFS family permease
MFVPRTLRIPERSGHSQRRHSQELCAQACIDSRVGLQAVHGLDRFPRSDRTAVHVRGEAQARVRDRRGIVRQPGRVVRLLCVSVYFASAFFPKGDPTVQLLNTTGVFAAGFLMRPLGGWMFGRIADRSGRKTSMVISVLMMCAGSLVIACLPTYESIGAWAPLLLLLARLFQGLSVGGEYGTTATYMSEVALRRQRGFYSSFQYVTLIGGQLLAVLAVVILQQVLSEPELEAWGWRIPFVIGAVTAVVALGLRSSLHETSTEATRASGNAGRLATLFREHKAAFFSVLGYTAGGSLIFYTFTTYMQKYLVNSAGMPIKTASNVMTGCLFVYMLLQPVFGALRHPLRRSERSRERYGPGLDMSVSRRMRSSYSSSVHVASSNTSQLS